MILIPKGKILVDQVSSYYVNIEKFCDYYQEVVGTFSIYFKSASSEGILFYDHSDYLAGGFRLKKSNAYDTRDVTTKLMKAAAIENFELAVYQIDLSDIYYWSSLFHAHNKYEGLNSDFTDLAALIKRMKAEELSGCIEVLFDDQHCGDLFFRNGEILHCHCFINEKPPNDLPGGNQDLSTLLYFSKKKRGVFNVKEINFSQSSATGSKVIRATSASNTKLVTTIIELILESLRRVLSKKPPRGFDFNLALKKKFIEKTGKYDFLDPFAEEFQYKDSKVVYLGKTGIEHVATAILEVARELAGDNGRSEPFNSALEQLINRYPKEFANLSHGT